MMDMKSTTLGIGVGHNYSFTFVPRPPEVDPPLLPQAIYNFPPITGSRNDNEPSRSHQSSSTFPDFETFPRRRFKRQAG
ncbi:hypothetical protein BaRGS_00000314 [Batillaria attramentaria]|uniref:Uncharacterized protein n=1 Tax=Batillaria attramentaria TaxID=370345 RepID=A0ABD0MA28_9CAEN